MNGIIWRGVVTEQVKFVADEQRAFRLWLAQFIGQDVEVRVRRRRRKPSAQARGYYWAALVRAFAEYTGEPSLLVAHLQLKRLILCTPDEDTPSTADAVFDSEDLADLTLKGAAFLAAEGVQVPEPEPDPLRRFEQQAMEHAR